jgi:hypothetical protein
MKNGDILRHKKFSVVICLRNLSIPQSMALEDLMATWQSLGSLGASRWTSFFADGDGDFRPKVLYNGHAPRHTDLIVKEELWHGSEYKIDYDTISWKLHDHEERRVLEAKRFNLFMVLFGTLIFFVKYTIKDIKLHIRLNNIRKNYKSCAKLQNGTGVNSDPPEPNEPSEALVRKSGTSMGN